MKKKLKENLCIFDYLYSKRHVVSIFQNVFFFFKSINAELVIRLLFFSSSLYVVSPITKHSPHVKSLLCESWDLIKALFCR